MSTKSPSQWSARYARQVEKHGLEEIRRRGRRNAKKHKDANKDAINAKRCEKRRSDPATRIDETVKKARTRGIAYSLPLELAETLVRSRCAYCGGGDEVNGLDRMDSSKSYEVGNVVAACATCNMAKGTLDPLSYIERCKHIACGERYTECWSDTYPGSVSYEKSILRHAEGKQVELTREMFDALTNRPCFYCYRPTTHRHKNGVDRMDPAEGYTVANSVAACGECNLMKKSLTSVEFFDLCIRVSDHDHTIDFSDVPRCPRVQHHDAYDMPVEQLDKEGKTVARFATIREAASSLGRDMHEATIMAGIKYWAQQPHNVRYGWRWRLVDQAPGNAP